MVVGGLLQLGVEETSNAHSSLRSVQPACPVRGQALSELSLHT